MILFLDILMLAVSILINSSNRFLWNVRFYHVCIANEKAVLTGNLFKAIVSL